MKTTRSVFFYTCLFCLITNSVSFAQRGANDVNTPLHLVEPDYPVPYKIPQSLEVKDKADRILSYLIAATPCPDGLNNDRTAPRPNRVPDKSIASPGGSFRLSSYEWGVTYSAMLRMAEVTSDNEYLKYTLSRLQYLKSLVSGSSANLAGSQAVDAQIKQLMNPGALDDAGSMCAAFIKAGFVLGERKSFDLIVRNSANFILNKEKRLPDGTFSRNRPFVNTVWLDDMYMSLPAIAQYGLYTGQNDYIRQAGQLVLRFADKLFVQEKNLFRHGWVESMTPHPSYFWGRANGWAFLTLCEILDVLPEYDPQRPMILSLYQRQAAGLLSMQSPKGFWHQLLDREDTYEETSATAIFTYGFAHGINKGWLNASAFGPAALLGWNALSTKITREGKVFGTCVGTGMGFDPAFYAYRPVSEAAAHGYGPVLYAAAEIILLLEKHHPVMNDRAIQFYEYPQRSGSPIFTEDRTTVESGRYRNENKKTDSSQSSDGVNSERQTRGKTQSGTEQRRR